MENTLWWETQVYNPNKQMKCIGHLKVINAVKNKAEII